MGMTVQAAIRADFQLTYGERPKKVSLKTKGSSFTLTATRDQHTMTWSGLIVDHRGTQLYQIHERR